MRVLRRETRRAGGYSERGMHVYGRRRRAGVDEAPAVPFVVAGRAEVARGLPDALGDLRRSGVGTEDPARDDQRRDRRDVRRRHRGADEAAPAEAVGPPVEGDLVDRSTGASALAVRIACQRRVRSSTRGDDVEVASEARVGRDAAELGGRSDGQDVLRARGIGEPFRVSVAGCGDDQAPVLGRVPKRPQQLRDLSGRDRSGRS